MFLEEIESGKGIVILMFGSHNVASTKIRFYICLKISVHLSVQMTYSHLIWDKYKYRCGHLIWDGGSSSILESVEEIM